MIFFKALFAIVVIGFASEEEIIKAKEILYSTLLAGDIYQNTVKGEQI